MINKNFPEKISLTSVGLFFCKIVCILKEVREKIIWIKMIININTLKT